MGNVKTILPFYKISGVIENNETLCPKILSQCEDHFFTSQVCFVKSYTVNVLIFTV